MKIFAGLFVVVSLLSSSAVMAHDWQAEVMEVFMSEEADCRELNNTKWPTKVCYLQQEGDDRMIKAKFRADNGEHYRLKSLIVCEEGFGGKPVCVD